MEDCTGEVVSEEDALDAYNHWLSVIMFFFGIREPSSVSEYELSDKVKRWLHLEKLGFLPVKLKKDG